MSRIQKMSKCNFCRTEYEVGLLKPILFNGRKLKACRWCKATFKKGMTKSAQIARFMACSTDDNHRRESQLWVAREIESFRDYKPTAIKKGGGE